MSLLQETIYDPRFEKLTPEKQDVALKRVWDSYTADQDFSDADLAKIEDKFNKKVTEYKTDMGFNKPIAEMDNPFNQLPQTKEEAISAGIEAKKQAEYRQDFNRFEAENQPLQDTTLDFAFAAGGLTKAGTGLFGKAIAKTDDARQAAEKSIAVGSAFAKGDIVGNVAATGAINATNDLMGKDFQQEYPLTAGIIQMGTGLLFGGYAGYKAEKAHLEKYAKLGEAVKSGKVSPQDAEEALQNEGFDVAEFLTKTKATKASDDLGLNNLEPTSQTIDPINVQANANFDTRIDNITKDDRFNELLEMRRGVSAKESQNPNNLITARQINTQNTGKGYEVDVTPATYEKNYNYDFHTTKQDVKDFENGKITEDLLSKLEADLSTLKNDPNWNQKPVNEIDYKTKLDELDAEPNPFDQDWEKANMLFSRGLDNAAVATYAGVEIDEDGNITLDPEKFIIGLGGYTVVKTALKNKQVRGKLKDILTDAVNKVNFNPEIQKQGNSLNSMFVGAKGDEIGAFSDVATKKTMREIDDNAAKFKENLYKVINSDQEVKLGDIFQHEELVNKYNDINDVKVSFDRSAGKSGASYNPRENKITLNVGDWQGEKDLKSTLLHEVQHAVQKQEGWARGGSPLTSSEQLSNGMENFYRKEISRLDKKVKDDYAAYYQAKWDELDQKIIDEKYQEYKFTETELEVIRDEFQTAKSHQKYKNYQKLWGEQQSRATEHRMDYSSKQRQGEAWTETLAKAEGKYEDPIIKYDDGVAMMSPVKSKAQKEKRGIWNVTFNGKNATEVRKSDLDSIIKYEKGFESNGKGFGALHVEKHLDNGSVGAVSKEELLQIGEVIRKGDISESYGKNVYELTQDGVSFKVVTGNTKNGKERVITYYSDRNMGEGAASPAAITSTSPNKTIIPQNSLLEKKKAQRLEQGLPETGGRKVYYPDRDKNYFYHPESDTVYFEARGKWREMPNEDIRKDIKYIHDNGVKAFKEKQLADDEAFKQAVKESEAREASKKDTYKMDHTAPSKDSGTAAQDLTDVYGEDIYSPNAARYFGHGNKNMDDESVKIIQAVRGKPYADVTIYRAVPKDLDVKINPDDWVTTSKTYAIEHGDGPLNGNYKILEMKVKAKDLYTDGNSIHEWGWSPEKQPDGMVAMASPSFSGAIAGFGEDEDGNLTFDPTKALAGLAVTAGGYASYKAYRKFKAGKLPEAGTLPDETKLQFAQRMMQDKFNRVKQLIKTKAGSDEIADAINPYQTEELYHGKVEARISDFEADTVEPIMQKIAASKVSIDDLDEYLHARHAIERNKRIYELNGKEFGSGMRDDLAEAIIRKYADNKELNEVAQMVYKMNSDRLKLLYTEGLENEDFIRKIDETYDNYVPLKRIMDNNGPAMRTGRGFDVKGKEIKRAKGSDRAVESPLMHSILAYQETIIRAEKNKVGKSFLDFIEKYPDQSLYEVSGVRHTPMYNNMGEVVGMNPNYQLADNVMHVKVDGKTKEIVIHDPALASAFKNLNAEQMGSLMRGVQKVVRFLASVNTQYNPEFVVSNFERDLQTAMINMPDNIKVNRAKILKDVGPAIKGIFGAERGRNSNEWSKIFMDMKRNGGTTGWLEQYNVSDMKARSQAIIDKYNGELAPKQAFKAVLQYVDDMNTAVENGVRTVAYKMALDSGLSKQKAASIAKNLTVNFNRKGEKGTLMNTMYMFYNASIQGTTRMFKALKDSNKAKGIAAAIAGTGYGLSMYNQSVNADEYDKIPSYVKDTSYIFMNEDGSYKTIKIPYGYNVFKSMGDIAAEYEKGEIKAGDIPKRVLSLMANAFSPISTAPELEQMFTPTVARPFQDLAMNKNFYGGNIKPNDNPFAINNKAEAYNHTKNATEASKGIAKTLNTATGGDQFNSGAIDISPNTLDYLFEYATGGLGKFISRSADAAVKSYKGEDLDVNKIPFVRAAVGETREKAALYKVINMYKDSGTNIYTKNQQDRFYRFAKEAVKAKHMDVSSYKKMVKGFRENQALKEWSKKWNIQSYDDAKKNKDAIRDAIKSGVKIKQIKDFYIKKDQ
ncbi:LPD38 domain-containing protein [Sulfurimonas sp.]|uniref:LPD38 domain-containing protein n=1 Tax=Sulfurimonas sp. TaxID=2022749 RepID=UPI00356323F5